MKRLLLFCFVLVAVQALAQSRELSCRVFVNDLYHKYRAIEGDIVAEHPELFTPELVTLLKTVDKEADGVGLDFVYFAGNQDPEERYILGRASLERNRCRVEYFEVRNGTKGNKPAAIPEVTFDGAGWRVSNIFYSEGPDLRTMAQNFIHDAREYKAEEKKRSRK